MALATGKVIFLTRHKPYSTRSPRFRIWCRRSLPNTKSKSPTSLSRRARAAARRTLWSVATSSLTGMKAKSAQLKHISPLCIITRRRNASNSLEKPSLRNRNIQHRQQWNSCSWTREYVRSRVPIIISRRLCNSTEMRTRPASSTVPILQSSRRIGYKLRHLSKIRVLRSMIKKIRQCCNRGAIPLTFHHRSHPASACKRCKCYKIHLRSSNFLRSRQLWRSHYRWSRYAPKRWRVISCPSRVLFARLPVLSRRSSRSGRNY
jgi:hypothetical protein